MPKLGQNRADAPGIGPVLAQLRHVMACLLGIHHWPFTTQRANKYLCLSSLLTHYWPIDPLTLSVWPLKVTFEIPLKISCPYIEKCVFHKVVRFWKLLDLTAGSNFFKGSLGHWSVIFIFHVPSVALQKHQGSELIKSSMLHYSDTIMRAMASQITSVSIVCSTFGSGTDQRKHQGSTSLAFMGGFTSVLCVPHTKGQ